MRIQSGGLCKAQEADEQSAKPNAKLYRWLQKAGSVAALRDGIFALHIRVYSASCCTTSVWGDSTTRLSATYLYEIQLLKHVWREQDLWNCSCAYIASRYGEKRDRHKGVSNGLDSSDHIFVICADGPCPHLSGLCHGSGNPNQAHERSLEVVKPYVVPKESYDADQQDG